MALSAGTRRTVACLLVGLGALLIVMALLIPTYTVGKLAKTPLDLQITTVASNQPGSESLVLDSKSLAAPQGAAKVDSNVPIISQRYLTVEEPSDADNLTIQAGQTVRRTDKQGDTGLLSAVVDRVTVDRKTGDPIAKVPNGSIAVETKKDGESIAAPVQHVGLQYRFPIGTDKKTYPYFDLNVRATFDINFVEETEINSTKVYHFQQTIPATSLWDAAQTASNKVSLPAAKWGLPGEDLITMTRYYTNIRDLWVEPKTGTIVKGGEQIHLYYAQKAAKPDVTALKSNLVFDENTIESQLAVAKDSIDELSLYGRTVPIVLGVLGVLALIAGLFLGLTGRNSTPAPSGRGSTTPPSGRGYGPSDRPTGPAGAAPSAPTGRPRGGDDSPTEQIDIRKGL